MFDKQRFAKIIKQIKETYNSQEEFSKKSGIGRTYLSQYMNMQLDKPPKPDILEKLSKSSNGITTYNELMQICGYVYITELTPSSYNIGINYWKMIFGDTKKVELSQKGSVFFSSFLNKMIEKSNECKTDDDSFEINFSTDLIIPKNCTPEELIEYSKLASFIICSLINGDIVSITAAEKEKLLKIVQEQLNFASSISSCNMSSEKKSSSNDFRYANHNGINTEGLTDDEIEEINRFVEFIKNKKKNEDGK